MELGPAYMEAGPWGLFLACFLAATVLPFSSEAVLGAMSLGPWSFGLLLTASSVGNTLGGLTTYGIGRWLPQERALRSFRLDPARVARWSNLIAARGSWVALLCWVPVIGDPIALALGFFRVPFVPCALLMAVGKTLRYAVLLWLLRFGMA